MTEPINYFKHFKLFQRVQDLSVLIRLNIHAKNYPSQKDYVRWFDFVVFERHVIEGNPMFHILNKIPND